MIRPQCQECGRISLPQFGFWTPCPCSPDGHHLRLQTVDIDINTVAIELGIAYENASHFDAAKFDKYASAETKALLDRLK